MTSLLQVLQLAVLAGVTVLPANAAEFDLSPSALEEAPIDSWSEARAYRFIWVPPFQSQRIISVRVRESGDGFELSAKAVKSGRIVLRKTRRLSAGEWEELSEARQQGFWKYHPQDYPQPFFDGAIWVLEGSAGGERLRVVQHVPSPGPFVDLCKMMLKLSGIRPADNEASLEQ
jgi:hypothetical protein